MACVDPVSETSRRAVVEPVEIVSLDAQTKRSQLGEVVTFGSKAGGATRLYLRFGDAWKTRAPIERAFVVLTPVPGSARENSEIVVEAWRIGDSWQREGLSWFAPPRVLGPRTETNVRPNTEASLYIDVTELSRLLAKEESGDNGILLLSESSGTFGASYSTGAAGELPRLEIYFAKQ